MTSVRKTNGWSPHSASPAVAKREPSDGERAYYLAFLWLGAIDGLLAQLPAGSQARAMIEGATAQAYRVSRNIVEPRLEGGA